MEKIYELKINPTMLKILGPNMYKNMYFILGELIANAWDADANNVYVIMKENKVIIEDDGNGMSYEDGDIDKYLMVGEETRTNLHDSLTKNLKRKKMGRKGLGKLAALSLADPVKVMTLKNNEKSGFVLTKNIDKNGKLKNIDESDIEFNYIKNKGTSIVMEDPKYIGHKEPQTIAKNISRIFPFSNDEFIIHVVKEGKPEVQITSAKETIIKELSTIITLGDEFEEYGKNVNPKYIEHESEKIIPISLRNNKGELVEKELIIKGWIGTYVSTKGRKADILDFQDNFISLYSNGKIGEFNILERIGKNTIAESYIVGELTIDLFEDSDLPDMALSNREGYMGSDIRYETTLKEARLLLDRIIRLRKIYTNDKNEKKISSKIERQKKLERKLKKKTIEYKTKIINTVTKSLESSNVSLQLQEKIMIDVSKSVEDNSKLLKLKTKVDTDKKKLLISHTSKDKFYVDLIYAMLVYNNLPEEEILYSSSENEKSRIPQEESVFGYLREFFVNSISSEKIHVAYVTSDNMHHSWWAAAEVGAGWITKSKHDIFNISNKEYAPKPPLNIEKTWNESEVNYTTEQIKMTRSQMDDFCGRIEKIVGNCGYQPQSREKNYSWLKSQVTIS